MGTSVVRQIVDVHRRQLFGLMEIRGVEKLKPFYEQVRVELEKRLRSLRRRGDGDTFQAHQLRQALLQVATAAHQVQVGVQDNLGDAGVAAAQLAPRHVLDAVERLQGHFTGTTAVLPVREAAVFQGTYQDVIPSLLDRFRRSSQLYGQPVVKAIRDQLTLGLLKKSSFDEMVSAVAGTSGIFATQRSRADRIVVTEVAHAYGAAKQHGMQELQREMPQARLQKRLVATFDSRTGDDSKELNGQTVDVDQPFIWVKPSGEVVRYMHPPNRPRDREIAIPWKSDWTVPVSLEEPGPVAPSTRGIPKK